MKRSMSIFAVASVLTLLFAVDSFAQMGPGFKWRGSGEWGMGTPYQRMYDPAKVETVTGTVEAVETSAPMMRMHRAVVLVLKTDKETIPVHLGPEWYIERLDIKILKGDAIKVKGARVSLSDKPVIIAGEIVRSTRRGSMASLTNFPFGGSTSLTAAGWLTLSPSASSRIAQLSWR